jgi:trans-AT polyketide synthase/acyltransferase/oxidoreductase domain-containing protein
MMGASYIVTGSVNHACIEAGTSEHTKQLLAQAAMADVVMAPCADMFEMGVKVQLLKRGSLFPMRAQKLYDLYQTYEGIDAIPTEVRQTIEKQIFQKPLEAVWQETLAYFQERDPEQIERANNNPKRKMALIFRWYLGLSSRWATSGQPQRTMDYQIWCGPAMGSFNDWVRGTYLEFSENRQVVDVATHIMRGAAYLYRLQSLKLQGVNLPSPYHFYRPTPL